MFYLTKKFALFAMVLAGVPGATAVRAQTPSFRHEIVPLLTRLGCNQGGCHGKLAGQNGFRLSLRGYALDWDHDWLTREFDGRRLDRVAPERSLLLLKPSLQVPHGGGKLLKEGSPAHQTLLAWIRAGAPGPIENEGALERLTIQAGETLLDVGGERSIAVTAHFSDGSSRDVTWLCQFFSNDENVLEVSPEGLVRALRPGEAAVRVHFEHVVEVVSLTVPYSNPVDPALYAARTNVIDDAIFAKLESLRIPPSGPSDDATFLRRAYLDAIGTLPTPDEVRSFLADPNPQKRSHAIDELLNRPEFVDYWTLHLADLLQNRKERDHDVRGAKGVRAFHAWLRNQVAANRPWNELATEVLTARGDSGANPQVGYFVVTVGEKRQAEESEVVDSVAQAFLGVRIGCARCHNHPLEKHTQDDYYHFAAFFSRVALDRRQPDQAPTRLLVASPGEADVLRRIEQIEKRIGELEAAPQQTDAQSTEKTAQELEGQRRQLEEARTQLEAKRHEPAQVRQPRTGAILAPQPLDGAPVETGEDPRQSLAAWMTRSDNPYFAGAMVNRLWRHFLGVGLVEPVDDLRASNPPSNPALWDALVSEFVSHGYDLKHVMRLILNSRVYQLSAETLPDNAHDRRFYSHYYARRLPAEVLLDAVGQATGVADEFPGYPRGMRAIQTPDASVNSYFLSLFGRSERVTACACERNGDVTLPQLLHLQNGDWIDAKLKSGDSRLAAQAREITDENQLIDEAFLTTLSRLPTAPERNATARVLAAAPDRQAALVDMYWSLMNTKEFAFNH